MMPRRYVLGVHGAPVGRDFRVIDQELLELLACPACRAEVGQEDDRIVCSGCGRRYPVREGIPIMLLDEAEIPEERSEGEV